MKNTSSNSFSSKNDKFQIVKRFKVVCPICGKKIWNDAVEVHNRAEAHW